MTARKAAILLPRIYAKLLTLCGLALPEAWFILPTVFSEFLELPRLRKALSVIRNKRRSTPKRRCPDETSTPRRGKKPTAYHV